MKQLLAILALTVFFISVHAQELPSMYPRDQFAVGMGAGVGLHPGGATVNLQAEYNVDRVIFTYSQSMYLSSSKPAFFELKSGYELNIESHSITPNIGYVYMLQSLDQGIHNSYLGYGAEYNWYVAPWMNYCPRIYLSYDRAGHYNLFAIGVKASL